MGKDFGDDLVKLRPRNGDGLTEGLWHVGGLQSRISALSTMSNGKSWVFWGPGAFSKFPQAGEGRETRSSPGCLRPSPPVRPEKPALPQKLSHFRRGGGHRSHVPGQA